MEKASIEEGLYKRVSINNLILFGIYSVIDTKKKCSFGILTQKCFNLFPQIFFLSQCSKWPDTRKLDRPLRTLRRKK